MRFFYIDLVTVSGAVPLHHMARVSRMTAARSSGAGGGGVIGGGSMSGSLAASQRGASLAGGGGSKIDPTLSLYPSINTLRSEQEDDDFSYKDCCKAGQSPVGVNDCVCVCVCACVYMLPLVKFQCECHVVVHFCLYTNI